MMHTGSTPSRVLDILEMEQGWMTIDALIADLELRWNAVKLDTVRRAVHRLIANDLIRSQLTLMPSRHDMRNQTQLEVRANGQANE